MPRRAVRHLDELPDAGRRAGIVIGVIATPADAAQEVADRLVAAGVSSILNFAPTVISVPEGVSLRKVDLAVELQILSFYQQRREGGPESVERAALAQQPAPQGPREALESSAAGADGPAAGT